MTRSKEPVGLYNDLSFKLRAAQRERGAYFQPQVCSYSCFWLEGRTVQGGNGVFHIWETRVPCSSVKQVILMATVEAYMLPVPLHYTITVAKLNSRSV